MDVSLVIDMQQGALQGAPKFDMEGVVSRINALNEAVRSRQGQVIFVQHTEKGGGPFAEGSEGWALLPGLDTDPADQRMKKHLNDAFLGTELEATLQAHQPHRVLISGWATDFCVDAAVRGAAARGFAVTAVADCHTVSERPQLSPCQVIDYHHWLWPQVIGPHPVEIRPHD